MLAFDGGHRNSGGVVDLGRNRAERERDPIRNLPEIDREWMASVQPYMEQMLRAAEQRIQEAETKRDVMQQVLQAAEQKILETGNKLADVDRENKAFTTQMKTRAERWRQRSGSA